MSDDYDITLDDVVPEPRPRRRRHRDIEWRRANKQSPCPVCDHGDWCSVGVEGGAVVAIMCRRQPSPGALARHDKSGAPYWLTWIEESPNA